MTILSASQTRIPPEQFNRVAYRSEVVRIEHRSGPCVYLISEDDWSLLQAAREARERLVDEAGDRATERFGELLRRLAK